MNNPKNYEHIVYIHEESGRTFLRIDRLFENGRRDVHTQIPIDAATSVEEAFGFLDEAANWLGQSICSDIPSFRSKVFGEVWPGGTNDQ